MGGANRRLGRIDKTTKGLKGLLGLALIILGGLIGIICINPVIITASVGMVLMALGVVFTALEISEYGV